MKNASQICDLNAEKAVLGEVLMINRLSHAKGLSADDFYDLKHRRIFTAMAELESNNGHIDLVCLANHLTKSEDLDKIGGLAYLTELPAFGIGECSMPHHVKIVKEEAIKRKIQNKVVEVKEGLHAADLDQIVSEMRQFYASLPSTLLDDIEFFSLDKFIHEARFYGKRGKETGFAQLDHNVRIYPGELVIIAARVRHGKSSFAYNLLLNFLEKYPEESFAFFNLDVSSVFMMTRLATVWAKKHAGKAFAYKDVLRCFQNEEFPGEIIKALKAFEAYGKDNRLAIVHKPNYSAEQIVAHAELLAKKRPLGAIFIDYMELIKSSNSRPESEELRIANIVNQLRIASEDLKIPIIVLAQLNRETVNGRKQENKRPVLEGLRYSGRQEQEASTVLGLFNPQQEQTDNADDTGRTSKFNTNSSILEVIPLKNRGGNSNKVIELDFDMVSGHITNYKNTGLDR